MQGQTEDLTVQLEKEFSVDPGVLFSALADGTVFELTGAVDIRIDFRASGLYHLDFGERNRKHCFIEGHFTKIVPGEVVVLIWNVTGFRAVPDRDNVVTFRIIDLNGSSKLTLKHEKIKTKESADGKRQGWREVLDDLETRIASRTVT